MLGTNQNLDGKTIAADEEPHDQNYTKHMNNYIREAEVVFSKGSVYAESIAGTVVGDTDDVATVGQFGSVMGMNDAQRRRVSQWLPLEKVPEGRFFPSRYNDSMALADHDRT